VIAIGILTSWVSTAVFQAFFFKEHYFVEELFFVGSAEENFLHALVILEFVVFGVIFHKIFVRRNKLEASLRLSELLLKEKSVRIELLNEKLRVVGSLTRHDICSKFSTVTGYVYLLKEKHADQADTVEGLGKIEQAVKDSIKIFDFAKMYEQIGVEELTYIDVAEQLKEAAALFSGLIPTIMNECHGLKVLADSFLRQVFYNFIDNTRKFGKKTTPIKVYYERADQGNLKLVYEDDGVGVPVENKPSLFKRGFGAGFGLFLTQKIIDVYGWTINEEGEPGKGAKFVITIPKVNPNGKENYRIALLGE
jgi:signal transduction histidine kinase